VPGYPLDPFLKPASVAVFGASEAPDSFAGRIFQNLQEAAFAGPLLAVNPRRQSVRGVASVPSLRAAGRGVDLAVLATPAATLPELLRDCAAAGVKGAIIASADLPAGGGRCVTPALVAELHRSGLRLLGPGSLGVVRPRAHLNATFSAGVTAPGALALVSQSGALCATILDWAAERAIGFSAVVAVGDELDLDLGDVLEGLALDDQTRGILLYVEDVRRARSFLSGLKVAARLKPVVVLRAGRYPGPLTPPGPRGDDRVFDAALARTGAVRAATVGQLFAAAQVLATGHRVNGSRLAIVTNARGPTMLAVDRALELGITLPEVSEATRLVLDEGLRPAAAHHNPVDVQGDAGPDRYALAVGACLQDGGFDAVLAMVAPQVPVPPLQMAERLQALARSSPTPLIACLMGGARIRPAREALGRAGVPEFKSPELAVEAFGFLARYRLHQAQLLEVPGPLAPGSEPDLERARRVVRNSLELGLAILPRKPARELLAAFAIPCRSTPTPRGAHGREFHLEVVRDPVFGPALHFGLGGSVRAGLHETVVALPPLNAILVRAALSGSRTAAFLNELEGATRQRTDALAQLLWSVSELICAVPEVVGLELSPLLLDGDGLAALDARVTLGAVPPGAAPYAHMAIHPFPTHLATQVTVKDGRRARVRPIRPEDAAAEAEFVKRLSPQARYFRFMLGLNELTPELLNRFTQIDYHLELALVAIAEEGGQDVQVGVARYKLQPDGTTVEFAVVVADAWQGVGLAKQLMQQLIAEARARGYTMMMGEILSQNTGIRRLMASLGFTFRAHPDGAMYGLGELPLQAVPTSAG
jgi:acetyltransferase